MEEMWEKRELMQSTIGQTLLSASSRLTIGSIEMGGRG